MTTPLVITLDGAAASGKSTTARALSEQLNLLHVDTGSHYRAVTWCLGDLGTDRTDAAAVEAAIGGLTLETRVEGRRAQIVINGHTPGEGELRSPEVNATVSHVAALPSVRQCLRSYQRGQAQVAAEHGLDGLVMEGRDIGSVIFPDAPLRFFLEADPQARAARRAAEGQVDAIAERDRIDASRTTAPMHCPEGAVRIDTVRHCLQEVVAIIAQAAAPLLPKADSDATL